MEALSLVKLSYFSMLDNIRCNYDKIVTRKLNIKQFCKDMYNLFGTPIGSHRSPNNLETCRITARNGHLDCLWIAWENGWSWDERVSKAAADSGTYPA